VDREDKGLVNLIILGLFLAVGLVRWIIHRAKVARGEKPGGPPPPEPKLPYEDMVDETFGPYIERRRRKHEEARARREEARREEESPIRVVEVVEEPRRPVPRPPPAEPPAVEEKPAVPASPAASEAHAPPPRLSLEERLFANPRWGTAAKLVLASEILGPPRCRRRPRPF